MRIKRSIEKKVAIISKTLNDTIEKFYADPI